jgi:iron complex transport system ATP-binding protein
MSFRIQDLTVRRGGKVVVQAVSCEVQPGEVLAILGPNGAGKSSMLEGALGLTPVESGSCSINGVDVLKVSPRERARLVSWVPQRSRLESALTVMEVVAQGRFPHRGDRFGLGLDDRTAVRRSLENVDAGHLAHRHFTTLSGGERARVLIARALATEAPVLLLDEPAAALDLGHALDLEALLRRLASAGRSVAIVLHDLDQARRCCDRALVLDRGQAVAAGLVAEVLTPELLAAVWGVVAQPGGWLWQRVES